MKISSINLLLILFIGYGQSVISQSKVIVSAIKTDSITSTDKKSFDAYTYSLKQALLAPEKVTHLSLGDSLVDNILNLTHLPSEIGKLKNLKVLELSCLEKLEDLPPEIGMLTNLEKLICDNGNGCSMNIKI